MFQSLVTSIKTVQGQFLYPKAINPVAKVIDSVQALKSHMVLFLDTIHLSLQDVAN